jgi:small subunit ribosomal protein S17
MDKTLVLLIEHKVKQPLYGKYVRRSTKYHVHDESNQGIIGDTVSVKECRPISKNKHWALLNVVGKSS